jgi:hypothetical protein
LTLDRDYAGVCGFTIPEFEKSLAVDLPGILEFNKSMGFVPANTTLAISRRWCMTFTTATLGTVNFAFNLIKTKLQPKTALI